MSSTSTNDIRLDILFKKFIGVPDANPNKDASSEAGFCRPGIIPSLQIYRDIIPDVSPTDLTHITSFSPINGNPTNGPNTSKYISNTYNYIAQYNNLVLTDATGSNLGVSFMYSRTDGFNLLKHAIPNNYDINTNTYVITVFGNDSYPIPSNDLTNPWIFDPDSGVLTFISDIVGYKMTKSPPAISFFRYEGAFGLSSNSDIQDDVSMSKRLFVSGDVSMNNNLFVSGDVSINGIIHANYPENSIPSSAVIGSNVSNTWIQSNMINAPPAIVFGTITATSTEIRIPWTYPTQIQINLFNTWVPAISSVNSTFSVVLNDNSIHNINCITNGTGNFLNNHNDVTGVTGIILSKVYGENTFEQRILDGNLRNVYVYHDTELQNMVENENNKIDIWYANSYPNVNKNSVILPIFIPSGPPSLPRSLIINMYSAVSGTFGYIAPLYVDRNNTTSTLPIIQYDVSYSTPGSNVRYGGPIAETSHSVWMNNGTNNSYTLSTLYPDCPYIIEVRATNGDNLTSNSVKIDFNTSYLTPIPSISSGLITFPANYYNNGQPKSIKNGTNKNNIINNNNQWTSYDFNVPIHSVANRSTTNTDIMHLTCEIINQSDPLVNISGPTVIFNGFSYDMPNSVDNNNMTITPSEVIDSYSGQNEYEGFYLQSKNTITIGANNFIASPYDYQFKVNQYQSGSLTGSCTTTYQYDTLHINSAPIINSCIINFYGTNNNSVKYVSGVSVIYGSPLFDITTNVSNMGKFYYSSPYINYYNCISGNWSPDVETNLSNITDGLGNESFESTIEIQNNSISLSPLDNIYTNSITLSIKANNIKASTDITYVAPISAIVDGPSVALLALIQANSTISPSNGTILTNSEYKVGFHIPSASMSTENAYYVPPLNNNGTGYNATEYDHSVSIVSTPDLQISNGKFVTPSYSSSDYSYINYNPYKYNSTSYNNVNYATINNTGYRFATFAWKVDRGQYASLSFKMDSPSPALTKKNNLAYVNNTSRLVLLYRIDENNITPSPSYAMASAWIDGNRQIGTITSSGNYYLPTGNNAYITEPNSGLSLFTSATSQFDVILPNGLNVNNTDNVYIYCRVGVPMNEAFSFKYLSAKLVSI